jgi:DNA-binding MarR family transcriptional regulator
MLTNQSIKDSVGYTLAQVCKLHRQRADNLLNTIGLHVGQEMFLTELWRKDGIPQTELAEQLSLQPATVTNSLRRIEREDIVERHDDSDDQRVSRVYLTGKGRGLEGPVEEKWGQLESEAFAGFSLEERVLLRRLLLQVYQNLAGHP